MDPAATAVPPGVDVQEQLVVHRVCTEFENKWQQGERPKIVHYLHGTSGSLRNLLIRELLFLDVEYAQRHGFVASSDGYLQDLPYDHDVVRQVFDELNKVDHAFHGSASAEASRFAVVSFHAQGGLGQVSLGIDRQFNREVAVKEIRPKFQGSDEHRRRFELEARITGCLEHPGIVPIHGIGRRADGNPYYAMRMIRGETLKDVISRLYQQSPSGHPSILEVRRLLARLIAVCQTIEYAHSRGVLHCDLKPANIMLGPYGETLVLDWGLALVLSDQKESIAGKIADDLRGCAVKSDPTPAGTPSYMSPEQAAGDTTSLGTFTDVYGLGATLYTALTGSPPVTGRSSSEVMDKVRRGELVPLRRMAPWAPAPLAAIVSKAMSLHPGERYASAGDLAIDLERWLADEPVTAFAEPWSDRVGRWLRRHRTWVMTITAATLVALLGLASAVIVQRHANRQIDEQRLAALENLRLARASVDDFHTRVATEDLLNRPGLQLLRRKLLSSAVAYNQQFVNRVTSHPILQQELASELATCHHRLADILGELGSLPEAKQQCRAAIAQREKLIEQNPGRIAGRASLAESWHLLGKLHILAEEFSQAKDALHRAHELQTGIVANANEPAYRDQLAATLGQLGWVQWNTDPHGALALYLQAAAIREQLVAEDGTNIEYAIGLANILNNVGLLQREIGESQGAATSFLRSIEIQEKVLEQEPSRLGVRVAYAKTCANLGIYYLVENRGERAGHFLRLAEESFRHLAEGNPDVLDYRKLLFRTIKERANARAIEGHTEEAIAVLEENRDAMITLLRTYPNHRDLSRDLANTHTSLGLLLLSSERADEAATTLEQGRLIVQQLVDGDPSNYYDRDLLVSILNGLARTRMQQQRNLDAIELLSEAVAQLRLLVENAPTPGRETFLSNTLWTLAQLFRTQGDVSSAAELARERLRRWPNAAEELFYAAIELAQSADAADNAIQTQEYREEAVQAIERAVQHGFTDWSRLRRAAELQPLQTDPRFRDALRRIRPEIDEEE